MTKFLQNKRFFKVLDRDISNQMVNKSTSRVKIDMPLNNRTNERILESNLPVDIIFSGFQEMDINLVLLELLNDGW